MQSEEVGEQSTEFSSRWEISQHDIYIKKMFLISRTVKLY